MLLFTACRSTRMKFCSTLARGELLFSLGSSGVSVNISVAISVGNVLDLFVETYSQLALVSSVRSYQLCWYCCRTGVGKRFPWVGNELIYVSAIDKTWWPGVVKVHCVDMGFSSINLIPHFHIVSLLVLNWDFLVEEISPPSFWRVKLVSWDPQQLVYHRAKSNLYSSFCIQHINVSSFCCFRLL